MKNEPFYVKDSLSSQFDNEDKIRNQKRLDFMEQQKIDYYNYLKIKDNKQSGTPFKITEDKNYHPKIKNLESQEANLCTNIAKDNLYTRNGYQVNKWKIPDKFEKNFDENYIKGKYKNGYNIINHQIYNVDEINDKNTNKTLRAELEQYEKNVKQNLQNQFPPVNRNNQDNNINNNNYKNYPIEENYIRNNNTQLPPLNNFYPTKQIDVNPQINNEQMLNEKQQNIPYEANINYQNDMKINNTNQKNEIDEEEYNNYLEYIRRKELMEKENQYKEYLRQKDLQEREEQEKKNIIIILTVYQIIIHL